MSATDTRLRTLYVMDILHKYSDEEHYLTAAEINKHLLSGYGFSSDRRSIYLDIEALQIYGNSNGFTIEKALGNKGWYVVERNFQLPELNLLIDAVNVAKFISDKQSKEIIEKLIKQTGVYQAKTLKRQIMLSNYVKNGYKNSLYTIDLIHNAMQKNCRLLFQYGEWSVKKELKPRRNGKVYEISPWGMLWNDEKYYMLGYDPEIDGIKHYRVDKMMNVKVVDCEVRNGEEVFKSYCKNFNQRTFGMYGGQDVTVKLKCRNEYAGIIIDRFGCDVNLLSEDNDYFCAYVMVSLSPQFYGWLTSVGNGIEILEPANVREKYICYINEVLEKYVQ